MGESCIFTVPDVDGFSPPTMRSKVDLPQPDGPVIMTISSFPAVNDTSMSTGSSSFSL